MAAQNKGTVDVTFEGNIAIVTLNCGENRLNSRFLEKMHSALDKVESNENVHALITTSTGKFFCNGIDLNWLMNRSSNEDASFMTDLAKLYYRLLTFPMLTVAAINGHCYAGGCLLALSHDYRVMRTERGRICMNEVHINLLFTKVLTQILRLKLPAGQTFHEFIVLGLAMTADEAQKLNIVDIATDDNLLMRDTKELITKTFKKNGRPYQRESLKNMKMDMFKSVLELIEPVPKPKL